MVKVSTMIDSFWSKTNAIGQIPLELTVG